ncbi:contact-dependent growth inhibition system immunity protein [Streptomyces sp. BRA346]|uniref:contact-dependent growth inhibition system immunity protein n=1 Tax=Streptomyces sp. BRA346 TaxID=2878199 RepID=UPI0040646152
MPHSPAPGHRFHEIQNLLRAYTHADYAFTDTPARPGPALEGYLRVISRFPQRGDRVLQELDDLLSVGLFSPEIADEVDLMPQVRPTEGRGVEESLSIARDHIRASQQKPSDYSAQAPQMGWEWEECFPELNQLIGGYFHQDFSYEYSSYREALEDYLRGNPQDDLRQAREEIPQLLAMAESDRELRRAVAALGMGVSPPDGVPLRQWLIDIAHVIERHLGGQPLWGEDH